MDIQFIEKRLFVDELIQNRLDLELIKHKMAYTFLKPDARQERLNQLELQLTLSNKRDIRSRSTDFDKRAKTKENQLFGLKLLMEFESSMGLTAKQNRTN